MSQTVLKIYYLEKGGLKLPKEMKVINVDPNDVKIKFPDKLQIQKTPISGVSLKQTKMSVTMPMPSPMPSLFVQFFAVLNLIKLIFVQTKKTPIINIFSQKKSYKHSDQSRARTAERKAGIIKSTDSLKNTELRWQSFWQKEKAEKKIDFGISADTLIANWNEKQSKENLELEKLKLKKSNQIKIYV